MVPSTLMLLFVEWAFWLAVGFVVYSHFGYPALLAILGRLRPAAAIRRGDATPPITILIVAHDEEAALHRKLRNCLSLDYPRDALEVLVVSDGSTDGTEDVAAKYASQGVRLLALPGPRGKAACISTALEACRGEVVVFCDVRQEIEQGAVRYLVADLADPTVGAVSGELWLRRGGRSGGGRGLSAYWSFEKVVRNLESRLDSVVGATGALYAIRRSLLHPIDPRTILDDVMIPMGAVLAGYRVVFEPAARVWDESPDQGDREFRRKVRTLAGNYQLVYLRPDLIHPRRNRLFWQFASHKLARLAVPWCLLVMLLTSSVLATQGLAFYSVILIAQAALGGLALAGCWVGRHRRAPAVLSIPYAFALLNAAAAAALFGFLGGSQRAAWRARS
jgi:cellulose synthase/poly-beta-1,6-N-acetylglucosamine synthase-like glycosyltransferase